MLILLAWLWFCASFAPAVRTAFERHDDVPRVEREGPEPINRNWPIKVLIRAVVSTAPAKSKGLTWST